MKGLCFKPFSNEGLGICCLVLCLVLKKVAPIFLNMVARLPVKLTIYHEYPFLSPRN